MILCDDGSVDNTYRIAKVAGATVVRHEVKDVLSVISLFDEGMPISRDILFRAKENNFIIKEVPVLV